MIDTIMMLLAGGSKSGPQTVNLSSGPPTTFESAITTNVSVASVTSSRAVVAYCDQSNNNSGTVCMLTVVGTTITAKTPIIFCSSTISYTSITKLSESLLLLVYKDTSIDDLMAVTLTISGDTITPNTPVSVSGNMSLALSVVTLSPSLAMCVYSSTSYYGIAIPLTISGTSVSAGTSCTIDEISTKLSLSAVDDTRAICCYSNHSDADKGTACILSANGTIASHGIQVEFDTTKCGDLAVAYAGNDCAIVLYRDEDNNYHGMACSLAISNTDVSIGDKIDVSGAAMAYPTIVCVSPGRTICAFRDDSNNRYATAVSVGTNGIDIDVSTSTEIFYPNQFGGGGMSKLDNGIAICGYQATTSRFGYASIIEEVI